MANRKNDVFCADNQYEEALMLMGRVNALAGIVQASKYSLDRELIAAVLGFELAEKKDDEQGGKAE